MTTHERVIKKLHPNRFTAMSGKMSAIVACILSEHWTNPALIEMTATSDGHLLGRRVKDIGFNEYLGTLSDLENNWQALLSAAGLTKAEKQYADTVYRVAVPMSMTVHR